MTKRYASKMLSAEWTNQLDQHLKNLLYYIEIITAKTFKLREELRCQHNASR